MVTTGLRWKVRWPPVGCLGLSARVQSNVLILLKITTYSTVVIFLKATKGKSQNRISLKQQRFLKNDKGKSFLDFYLVYKYVYLKVMR